jgi:hypothetical protein
LLGYKRNVLVKNTEDARLWLEKEVALYPANNNANILLGGI